MKASTAAAKLNALLGIKEEQVQELASESNPAVAEQIAKKRQEEFKNQPKIYGYRPDEFEQIRIMQGTLYFLQAPELFTIQQCPSCNEWFAVSRQAVGYCSYACMNVAFKEAGLVFTKGGDLEALANDPHVWRKNEPLWTIKLSKLQKCLQVITEAIESSWTQESESDSDTSPKSITTTESSTTLRML